MEINADHQDNTLIVRVVERIDGANASDFEQSLEKLVDGESAVLLDLVDLVYISSAGLRALLRMAKTLSQRDLGFALCTPSDNIRRIFEISGFDRIIPIHESRSQALASGVSKPSLGISD